MTSTLTVRLTATEAARVYEQAAASIRQGCELVKSAEQLLADTFTMNGSGYLYVDRRILDWSDPERALLELRHKVWKQLIERLELRRHLSIERADELDRQIRDCKLPEITEQAIADLCVSFTAQLDDMRHEAVAEVFEFLRPHNSKLKTNTQFELGKRVVIERAVHWCKYIKKYEINSYTETRFTALENVFMALDGAGIAHRGYYSDLSNAVRKTLDGQFETAYFRGRAFKNSNVHIEFLRPELVAQLNQIAGGKRLKPEVAK